MEKKLIQCFFTPDMAGYKGRCFTCTYTFEDGCLYPRTTYTEGVLIRENDSALILPTREISVREYEEVVLGEGLDHVKCVTKGA